MLTRLNYAIGWLKESKEEVGEKIRSKFVFITKGVLSKIEMPIFLRYSMMNGTNNVLNVSPDLFNRVGVVSLSISKFSFGMIGRLVMVTNRGTSIGDTLVSVKC